MWSKARTALADNPLLAGGLGGVLGLIVGWCFGGFLSCARSESGCEWRADSISALGTWVGAVGTVAGVFAAVAVLSAEKGARSDSLSKERRDEEARRAASFRSADRVQFGVRVLARTATGSPTSYAIKVTNSGGSAIANVTLRDCNDKHHKFPVYPIVEPGASHQFRRETKDWVPRQGFSTDKAFIEYLKPTIKCTYSVGEYVWRKSPGESASLLTGDLPSTEPLVPVSEDDSQ